MRRNETVQRIALGLLLIAALFAVPTFRLTGEPAEDGVQGLPEFQKPLIEQHEKVAGVALGVRWWSSTGAGRADLVSQPTTHASVVWPVMLTGALIVSGLMGWTASLGGQVRHTEIRSECARAVAVG